MRVINSEGQQRASLTLRLIASHEPLKLLDNKSNGRIRVPCPRLKQCVGKECVLSRNCIAKMLLF